MSCRWLSYALLTTLGLGACSATDYDFTVVEDDSLEGAAFKVEEIPELEQRLESFAVGTDTRSPVADYLFVVDGSASMHKVLEKFRAGIDSLATQDPFPTKARIAVMSTLPADPADLSRPHPAANDIPAYVHEPGFLSLVDRASIDGYRETAPMAQARHFRWDGCENPWFKPWQRNRDGVLCLFAHTQISRSRVGIEDGPTAFKQFLLKNSGTPVFRQGAAVNVVFVSDTHPPGLVLTRRAEDRGADLDPVTFDELLALAQIDNTMSSFRVHSIAPRSECGERWPDAGLRYHDLARDGGGVALDICATDDYAPFIRDIAGNGAARQQPIFTLSKRAAEVHAVEVDGVEVPFELLDGGRMIRLQGDATAADEQVLTINYTYR